MSMCAYICCDQYSSTTAPSNSTWEFAGLRTCAVACVLSSWLAQAERAGVAASPTGSQLSTAQHLLAGCVAGAAATAVTYPLETLRTHMAMGCSHYGNVARFVASSSTHNGCFYCLSSALQLR